MFMLWFEGLEGCPTRPGPVRSSGFVTHGDAIKPVDPRLPGLADGVKGSVVVFNSEENAAEWLKVWTEATAWPTEAYSIRPIKPKRHWLLDTPICPPRF